MKQPTARGVPWGVIGGVVRVAVPIWLLLRSLLAATPLLVGRLPIPPYVGGVREAAVLLILVPLLVLRDARRVNERVFAANVGVSEIVLGSTAAVVAMLLEGFLHLAVAWLPSGPS